MRVTGHVPASGSASRCTGDREPSPDFSWPWTARVLRQGLEWPQPPPPRRTGVCFLQRAPQPRLRALVFACFQRTRQVQPLGTTPPEACGRRPAGCGHQLRTLCEKYHPPCWACASPGGVSGGPSARRGGGSRQAPRFIQHKVSWLLRLAITHAEPSPQPLSHNSTGT